MKNAHIPFTLSFLLLFSFNSTNVFGQYLETFSITDKGILSGCAGTEASCTSDFTGVDWTINGDFSGMDSNDFISTDGSVLTFSDVDAEMCYESPILDISAVAANFSFSVFVLWEGHDMEDYIDVEYQIDGGSWAQVSNVAGGGIHTVDFSTAGNSGSTTIGETGLSGTSTVSIRVCVNINLFPPFEFASIDNVSVPGAVILSDALPVELISFEAEKREKTVQLNWATASETNNEKFEIEHSATGDHFEKIGETVGLGSIVDFAQYAFIHENPLTGQNYYRLKQIDFDGQFEYSKVINVRVEREKVKGSSFYPNPTKDGVVTLDYSSIRASTLTAYIYDATGRIVLKRQAEIVKGRNNIDFNFSNLEKGIYFVQLKNGSDMSYQKLIIN